MRVKKSESEKIQKLAKSLRVELEKLSKKYYDENAYGPTADLYVAAFDEIYKLKNEIVWWVV